MKFKRKPQILDPEEQIKKETLADKILSGADYKSVDSTTDDNKAKNTAPWEDIPVSKDVVVFSFRVPKKDMKKLKYASKETCMSINTICLRAIRDFNRKTFREIKKDI